MPTPIHEFAADLLSEFHRDPQAPGVVGLMARYTAEHDDWREYALFDDATYTRNLVVRNDTFDLIVLGWGKGQESPIHNHSGQRCWMSILEGAIEEIFFETPDEPRAGPLTPGRSRAYAPGEVAYITDDIALHLIRPIGGRATSLHLYSLPYDECNVYDPETGAIERRELSFHSIDRKLTANAING
jgi:cysteine dioxygenase